jgi:aspartate 1-decarboxylase
MVWIANVSNGARFETYALEGERNSGVVALNGAAARLCSVNDKIIIMGYELTNEPIKAKVVTVDDDNKAVKEFTY